MASKAYTITMPEELMAVVDQMAREEHRNRSEMLREMVRIVAGRRIVAAGDTLGAVGCLLEPLRGSTAAMSDEQYDQAVADAIREARDAHCGTGHERAPASGPAPERT